MCISRPGASLVRQGGDVNSKACKIQPWLRTDLKSSPATSVILNCSNFRNDPRIVQNHRFRPHCAEDAFNRHKCCMYTKLLLQTMHTSSSSFIELQLCCVWPPYVQKNASITLRMNNTVKSTTGSSIVKGQGVLAVTVLRLV